MARDVNRITLRGRLAQDPRIVTEGHPRVVLRVATNRTYQQGGETRRQATFHPVVCWGTQFVERLQGLKKGDPVQLEGRVEYTSATDSEGQDRMYYTVVCRDIVTLRS